MFGKVLFKPAALHDGKEQERHSTWLELLYDLIFVAAVAQLASLLYADFTTSGLLRFVFISIPVWWAWVGHTFYLTRFDADDPGHRLLTMLQMVAVAALATNVPGALGANSAGFALSYAAVRGILVIEYVRAGWNLPEARLLTSRYSTGFGAAILLWLFSLYYQPPLRFVFWIGAILIDFLTPMTAKSIHLRFPPHHMHLPERFGLFTIIVIGEAVAGVVAGDSSHGHSLFAALSGVMGLIISFALWWGYFEGARGASIRVVNSFEHVGRYQLWLYAHLPLVMGITATAVGVRHVIALQPLQALSSQQSLLFSGAVGASCLALNSIFLASYPASRSREMHRYLIPHYFIAILGAGIGVFGDALPGIAVLAILMTLCLTQIILSLRARPD